MRQKLRNTRLPVARGTGRKERGSIAIEIAILFPLVLLLTFGVIEGALWYHARNIALAAAEEGVRAATVDGADPADGASVAESFAESAASDNLLSNIDATVSSTETEVTVTVTGTSLSLFPGWVGHEVSQTASGTRERFTSPDVP